MSGKTTTRMPVATAALAAVVALFAGPGNAMLLPVAPVEPGTELGPGMGVGESLSAGIESRAGSTRYGYVVGGELIVPGYAGEPSAAAFDRVADPGVAASSGDDFEQRRWRPSAGQRR